jgi:hypothetical protein
MQPRAILGMKALLKLFGQILITRTWKKDYIPYENLKIH